MSANKLRVLLWDIETSLQLAAIFSLQHNDFISPDSLVTERYIICAAWSWEGENKVQSVAVTDDPKRYAKNPHDDYYVVKTLHKVLSEADVLVHHNGDSFDRKWLDTRILVHGLAPLPPISSIDTCKVAKARFYLNSNSLNYLGKLLKVGQKIKTSANLWMRVLSGEKKAVVEMTTYCKGDITLLREVFYKLKPYVTNYPNVELFGGPDDGCPRCGSQKVQSRGVHRAITRTYQRWQCQACGGWFRTLRAVEGSATASRVM